MTAAIKTLIGDRVFDVKQDRILEAFDKDNNSVFKIDESGNITPEIPSLRSTTRITDADSPYDILNENDVLYCDSDAGPINVNMPAGINGKQYRIINTGSSGNDVTITPDGSELLAGSNSSDTISDGSVVVLVYETTEGWW
jgi:hypothetical protein